MRRNLLTWAIAAFLAMAPAIAADNVAVTAGSGTTMAAKDIGGGVLAPKVYPVDGSGNACTGAAGASSTCVVGVQGVSGGTAIPVSLSEGCGGQALSSTSFTQTSIATSSQVIAGTSAKQTYICFVKVGPMGTATNYTIVEGTGSVCGTGTGAVFDGSTTAANGSNAAANGGEIAGSGRYVIARTVTAADNICVLLSAANQVPISIVSVQF